MSVIPVKADIRAGKRQKKKSSRIRNGLKLLSFPLLATSAGAKPIPVQSENGIEDISHHPRIDEYNHSLQLEDDLNDSESYNIIPKPRQLIPSEEENDEIEEGSSRFTSFDQEDNDLQLKEIQQDWYQDHVSIPVSPNSHVVSDEQKNDVKGKGKANDLHSGHSSYPHSRRRYRPNGGIMRFNSQKGPFHSSQVGTLAARQPAILSVGLFQPNYPFVPSGRRKLREVDVNTRSRGLVNPNDTDVRAEKVPFAAIYTVSDEIANGNIFKHGWSTWMLDDELRLAVPDEQRRPRKDSALMIAKNMMGKKWYRWQTGEGYVFCRLKNYSTYKTGPGIALGQLLPPREHAYTSPLPLIPNDSKRDFIWLIIVWIAILSLIAIVREVRNSVRKFRKGKRRSLVEGAPLVPSIRIFDEGSSPLRASSMDYVSIGLRTRQRTQAQHFRNLCKSAFFPVIGVSDKKRSSFSSADSGSLKLDALNWSKNRLENENDTSIATNSSVLPISTKSHDLKDPSLLNGTSRIAMRRSRSSSAYTIGNSSGQKEFQQAEMAEKGGFVGAYNQGSTNNGEVGPTTNGYLTKSSSHNRNLYANENYRGNDGGGAKGSIFPSMPKMHTTVSH